jgi:prepilin-type N-terminal cleavage/methylation domain-containing protein
MNAKNIKSFTLMEMMVTVLIAAVLASMALVGYRRSILLADVEDGIRQLTLIHGAQQIYKAKNWKYWIPATQNFTPISQINNALGLELPDDKFDFYYFNSADGTSWTTEIHYRGSPIFFVEASSQPLGSLNPRCNYNCP